MTHLRWEYISGSELWEHVEIWHNGERIATNERSIAVRAGAYFAFVVPALAGFLRCLRYLL